MQNVVVYAEGGKFAVAAGGRRYRALKQLEKARTIPACHPVAVDVRDKAEAIELSQAKSVQREAMHSADAVDAYRDAGGTITADLFAGEGDGYADDPALVEALAMAKLDGIAASYRAEGWQDVWTSPERPHDYYGFTHVHPGGLREPSSEERCELDRIAEAIAARLGALGEANAWGDAELDALRRDQRRIEHRLLAFTAGQKAESAMILSGARSLALEPFPEG